MTPQTGFSRHILFLALVAALLLGNAAHAALTITMTKDIDTVRPSELLQLEIMVANTDAVARTGVVITMLYPANLNQTNETEFEGDCPSTTCSVGETVTWTLGTLAAGDVRVVDLPPTVAAAAADGTVITFSPTVTDDLGDSDATSTDVTVNTGSIYDISLAEDADAARAGGSLTYRLSFSLRADAGAVHNSTLRLPLPAGTSFVSATDGGALNGSTVEWALGFLLPGEGGTRDVTLALDAGLDDGTVIEAQGEMQSITAPAQLAASSTATAIASSTPLGLAIEAVIDTVRQNELVNFQLTVTNNDPFTRFGVVLRGRYPAALNQALETEFDGNCASTTCTAGEQITWTLGDIPAGASTTVDLIPVVAASALGGTLINLAASASDAGGASVRRTRSIRVQTDTRYDLSLAANASPTVVDDQLSYQLSFGHRADAPSVMNTLLTFPVPAGTTFVSATDGGTLNAGTVEWPLGFLSPGNAGFREVIVQVDAGLDAGFVIEAEALMSGVTAPLERARAQANTPVASSQPLSLAVEINPNPAVANELTQMHVTVSNNDPFTRFGVGLTLRYPQNLNQVLETEFDGNCGSTTCTAGERATWSLGNIPAGGSVTVDMIPVVAGNVTGATLVNFFVWASDDQGSETRQTETLRVVNGMPYDLSLSEHADPALPDSLLTYKLVYGYRADAGAVSNSQLRFIVPPQLNFVSATGGGVLNGNVVEWPAGFASPGEGGVRFATLAIPDDVAAGTLIEARAEYGSVADPDVALRAAATTAVATSAPLALHVETNPGAARLNETTNLQISVANRDPFTRFGVVLTGRFPQSVNQAIETEFDGNCGSTTCTAGERVIWNLGDIPAGGVASVDLPAQLAGSGTDGSLVNFYFAARDDQDAHARRLDTVRIQNDTLYDLSVVEATDPVATGSQITYAVTYGYLADAGQVTDSDLRFTLPTDTSFVSASAGGVAGGGTVEWNLGQLSPGDGDVRTVTVAMDGGVAPGTVLEASAEIFSGGTESLQAEADAIVTTSPRLVLDIVPNRNNVESGAPLSLLLGVTNNDAVTRFGVTVAARFPQRLNSLSETSFTGNCGSTTCTAGERVLWTLGDIAPGASVFVDFPPTVATVLDGELINFFVWARDDQNVQTRDMQSMLAGCLDAIDADCDGISDNADNCLLAPNLGQRDTDVDGLGNVCDADIRVPNDCQVNFLDLGTMKAAFFATPADANWNADADHNGDDNVNFVDLGVMKAGFFVDPGPSGIPNACD